MQINSCQMPVINISDMQDSWNITGNKLKMDNVIQIERYQRQISITAVKTNSAKVGT